MFVMYAVIKWSDVMGMANSGAHHTFLMCSCKTKLIWKLKRHTTLLAVGDCVTFKKIYTFISSKFLFLARDDRIFEVYVNHS